VLLDRDCIEKMDELEPEERASVVADFEAENDDHEIRNPSSWLFARSRARLVQRVTGGRASAPRSSSGRGRKESMSEEAELFEHGDPFQELGSLGVDEQALSKLRELSVEDLRQLLAQFMELHGQHQIDNPSKWLFSRARTIAARISQQERSLHQAQQALPAGKPGGALGAGGSVAATIVAALAAAGVRLPPAALSAAASAISLGTLGGRGSSSFASGAPSSGGRGSGSRGGAPELRGVDLDSKALSKLEELEPHERSDLFEEYEAEASRKSIQNPSAWIFGRARTKVVERIMGKGGWSSHRYSPY